MEEVFSHSAGNDNKNGTKVIRKDPKSGHDLELTAPDGGWGYAVCVGIGVVFMLGFGSSSAFGILFNDFFQDLGDGASGLTLVIGVYNGSLSIAGFISGLALKSYSFRRVGLLGAALFLAGDVLTVFVTSTYQLALTFGLIRGVGFGMMIPVGYTAFNCYFTRKRTAMMSANQAMSSLASISFPILVTSCMEEYGFRATLALLAAVDLHLLAAMLVMHPVRWHLVPRPAGATRLNSINNEGNNSLTNTCHEDKLSLPEKADASPLQDSNSEYTSRRLWDKISEVIEVDLLRRARFVNVMVGIGFAFVSDVTYLALEPMLLFYYGYTKTEVAYCVMLGAGADLLARTLLAVYSCFRQVHSRRFFFVGVCITVFLRIALVSGRGYAYVCAVTALSGLVRCAVQVMFPLVLAAAARDRFAAALGLHILFSGALMLLADPLIGVIYQLTGSYVYCFIAMSSCCLVCVCLWTGEYLFFRKKK